MTSQEFCSKVVKLYVFIRERTVCVIDLSAALDSYSLWEVMKSCEKLLDPQMKGDMRLRNML